MRFSQSIHLLKILSLEIFNDHHKDRLTDSGGTDRPGELCHNFSVSNDLTQMVNFPTWIPDCSPHSAALLDLFISSDSSICSTMAFPPLENWGHVVFSVSIVFPSNSFNFVLIGTVFVISIFKLGASAAAIEFCWWVQIGTDGYIPHRKYEVKSHSSMAFSCLCCLCCFARAACAACVHRNHFFSFVPKG